MEHKTILYISNRANSSNPVLVELEEMGYEIVSTDSPTEGVALLYIMHSVAAAVIDTRVIEQASFDVAVSLSKIRPNIPVMLLCGDYIDGSPSSTESCVSTDKLTSELQHLLTDEPVVH